jgi:hypothetical protein
LISLNTRLLASDGVLGSKKMFAFSAVAFVIWEWAIKIERIETYDGAIHKSPFGRFWPLPKSQGRAGV